MNIERSISLKFSVSTEPKLEASDHTFDENSDSTSSIGRNREMVQINNPSSLVSELDVAATKIQKVYRSYRSRRNDAAATKIQKVYKSYRTRRNFADCAVGVEELWWKQSSESLNIEQQETVESSGERARTSVAQIDPRHRYGHNLLFYFDVWCESNSIQPFFYWLDIGDGKDTHLKNCPRTDLQRQCIRYLGPVIKEDILPWSCYFSGVDFLTQWPLPRDFVNSF